MSAVRLFVANLPENCTKNALNTLFADYGKVEAIELKPSKATTEGDKNARNIAFVTIKSQNIENCVYELNGWKFNGQIIQVAVAKESFLDRLKREREEAATADKSVNNLLAENLQSSVPSSLNKQINKRKIFNETDADADVIDDEDAEDTLLVKKYAACSMQNGKIVIENVQCEPLHIIEAKKTIVKEKLNEKVKNADLKRKDSFKKLVEIHKQRQAIVQNALSAVGNSAATKIIFSDENETAEKKAKLFESDDEADNHDIDDLSTKVKQNNNELYKLQKEMPTTDKRFQVDERFLNEQERSKLKENADEDNEKDWQMDILEQVVGEQLGCSIKSAAKAKPKKQMLRYDPTAENQQTYLPSKAKKAKPNESSSKEKSDDDAHSADEMFYMVSDTLASSLKKQPTDTAFSLLSLFGRASHEVQDERNDQLKKISKEKVIINNKDWSGKNPFSYDSTDSSDNEEIDVLVEKIETKNKITSAKPKILLEPFFFNSKDERFQEGLKFFTVQKQDVTDYEPTRQRLNLVIKQQIHKKQKAMKRPKKFLRIKK